MTSHKDVWNISEQSPVIRWISDSLHRVPTFNRHIHQDIVNAAFCPEGHANRNSLVGPTGATRSAASTNTACSSEHVSPPSEPRNFNQSFGPADGADCIDLTSAQNEEPRKREDGF